MPDQKCKSQHQRPGQALSDPPGSRWTAEQIERGIDEHIKWMKSWVEWEKRTRNDNCKETDTMVMLSKEYEEKLQDEKSLREEIRGGMILS